MLGYDTLANFYKTNFNLMQFHKYSLSDLENMIPWERHLYIDMLKEHIKKENERIRDEAAVRKSQQKRHK